MVEKKSILWLIIGIVAVVLLCLCVTTGGLVWYFGFGPGALQIGKADNLVKKATTHYKEAMDTTEEIQTLNDDLNEIDLMEPGGTDLFEAKLKEIEEEAGKIESEIDQATKYLEEAKQLRLPDWYKRYLSLLIKRDKSAVEGVDYFQDGLRELRRMLGYIPLLNDGINKLNQAIAKMEEIPTAMQNLDFNMALTLIDEADALLSAAYFSFNSANAEIKSKDLDAMLEFIKQERKVLSIMKKLIEAAQAGDVNRVNELTQQLTTENAEAQQKASEVGVTGDLKGWFMKRLESYGKKWQSAFTQANLYDKEAQDLYRKHKKRQR